MTDARNLRQGADNDRWFRPYRPADGDNSYGEGWTVQVGPHSDEDWKHTSLAIAELAAGQHSSLSLTGVEAVIVPLAGGCTVRVSSGGSEHPNTEYTEHVLTGRASVFSGPSDTLYVPAGRTVHLTATDNAPARIAVAGARVDDPTGGGREPILTPAGEVPVELRGAGVCSREVRGFGMPPALQGPETILVCEVLTPAGGWSSYPPHKHDTDRPGQENVLEEIYYFETQPAGSGPDRATVPRDRQTPDSRPVGFQQVYSTDPDRPIDVLAEVTTGDVILIPHGWHGPAMAAPDADLYYLNVMSGPGETREWLICDDPAHTGIRESWERDAVDPRLPFGGDR